MWFCRCRQKPQGPLAIGKPRDFGWKIAGAPHQNSVTPCSSCSLDAGLFRNHSDDESAKRLRPRDHDLTQSVGSTVLKDDAVRTD
jgi:hypothetical protein